MWSIIFGSKDAIYTDLLQSLLEVWVQPLRDLSEDADPLAAILTYMRRKLRMSQEMPRESKMFATEILHGAPRMRQQLSGDLKSLVDEKAALIARWSAEGKIAKIDPHHLIFSIWAMTQHYADFDIQVEAVLGDDRKAGLYDEADAFLTEFFRAGASALSSIKSATSVAATPSRISAAGQRPALISHKTTHEGTRYV